MNLWIVEASVCSVGLYNLVINSDLETPGQRAPAPATLNLTGLGARVCCQKLLELLFMWGAHFYQSNAINDTTTDSWDFLNICF